MVALNGVSVQESFDSSQGSLDIHDLLDDDSKEKNQSTVLSWTQQKKVESTPSPTSSDERENGLISINTISLDGSMNLKNNLNDNDFEQDETPRRRPPKRSGSTGAMAKKWDDQLIPSIRPSPSNTRRTTSRKLRAMIV
jgi:hypothetical protein